MMNLNLHFQHTLQITIEKIIAAADSTQLNELILLADKKLRRLEAEEEMFYSENNKNTIDIKKLFNPEKL